MLTNIFSYVVDALAYQGIVIVAWVAVALAHVVYLRRHGLTAANTEFRPGRIPALNPGGILGWGIASVVGIVLKITDTTTSQFFDTWGLPLTFVLGFVIYTAATHFAKPSWFAMRRENDPALEVDDPERVDLIPVQPAEVHSHQQGRHSIIGHPALGVGEDQVPDLPGLEPLAVAFAFDQTGTII